MLKLVLTGNPTPQARMRIWKRGRKTMVYDPCAAIKKSLRDQVKDQITHMPLMKMPKNPRITFWFQMPIPKSMTKKEREIANAGNLKHRKKPDVDNLIKLYLDVLSGLVFEDDNCVSLGSAIKIYSQTPKTVIYIQETNETLSRDEIDIGSNEIDLY